MLKRIAGSVRRQDWFAVVIEVLVVVIGLLLAFQLDGWRETRLERQEERTYIDRLTTDIETDIPEIEHAIELQKLRLELVDLLIEVAREPQAALTMPAVFMGAVSQAAYTYTPELTSHTFENLRSTGDLKLIRNESLKDALFGYYGFDMSQRQYRPLQFATEHRHFELAAGILSLAQERYTQEHWLFFNPGEMEEPKSAKPEIEGILEAARRLQSRPDFIAWLPYVRSMQAEQIEVHGMRLQRAQNMLGLLQAYAAEIGDNRSGF
jgi:hypothetical protein